MSTLAWRIVVLVVVVRAIPEPSSSSSRDRRQVDTSNLSDAELLCHLAAAVDGSIPNCDQPQPPQPPPPQPPPPSQSEPQVQPGGGCTCAPAWQCTDGHQHGPDEQELDLKGFLSLVSVRTDFNRCPTPEEVCCHNIDKTLQPQVLPFSPSCGKRNTQGIVMNFVGFQNRQSQFGEFPWMVAVMTSERFGPIEAPLYICGGSLIHGQVVLTAAHYVQGKTPGELAVRLGEWNFKEQSESVPYQEYGVTEVLIHPNYVGNLLIYDVALLILDSPATLGHTIDTICLPPPNYDFKDHICVVSGWGKDMFNENGKYQQILKSIELPPVDHTSCELAMRGTRLGPSFHLHESFMCAGGEEGKDACEGDGGSPLACHKPGDPSKYYQAGVVSWGIGCGKAGIPGVYADVGKAVSWINQMIGSRFGHNIRMAG